MKPELNLIVAVSKNYAIGKDNQLLWHLPADLKFFKQTTLGFPIVMGRKTFESIGRVLPGRKNIILTRKKDFCPEGALCFASLEEALEGLRDEEKIFIIGGGQIYSKYLNACKWVYITHVDVTIQNADTFFPNIENHLEFVKEWEERHSPDEKNKYHFCFARYRNKLI